MHTVFVLADRNDGACPLLDVIGQAGLSSQMAADLMPLEQSEVSPQPEAVLLDLDSVGQAQAKRFIDRCKVLRLPVLAVVPRDHVEEYDPSLDPDELVFTPVDAGELLARIKQAIYRVNGPAGSQVLKVGDITIDLEKYDVTVAGRRVSLTYKEFQLLLLLASNPGRVYSRESLLSQVWGYDYLGGTRTVDVHVRRLRAKIETPGRSLIETVYLVGYRFKAPT